MSKCKHGKSRLISVEKLKPKEKGNFYISNIVQIRKCEKCGKKYQKRLTKKLLKDDFYERNPT